MLRPLFTISCSWSESCGSMQIKLHPQNSNPTQTVLPLQPPNSSDPRVLSVVNMFRGCGIPKNGHPRPSQTSPALPPYNCWNLTVFSVRLLSFCLFFGIFAAFFCCLKQWCELMSRTKLDVTKVRSKRSWEKIYKKIIMLGLRKGFKYREKKLW